MSNKQWLGRILVGVVIVVLLIGAGCAIYRVGYTRGIMAARVDEGTPARFLGRFDFPQGQVEGRRAWLQEHPGFLEGQHSAWPKRYPGHMPHDFDQGFLPTSHFVGVRSFTSPWLPVLYAAVFVFMIWLGYKLIVGIFQGKGWQLSFQKTVEDVKPSDGNESGKSKS